MYGSGPSFLPPADCYCPGNTRSRPPSLGIHLRLYLLVVGEKKFFFRAIKFKDMDIKKYIFTYIATFYNNLYLVIYDNNKYNKYI